MKKVLFFAFALLLLISASTGGNVNGTGNNQPMGATNQFDASWWNEVVIWVQSLF